MLYIGDFRKVDNCRPSIAQSTTEIQIFNRYLHKLSIDIRVSYAISNIQLEQEVHVEHRFDDCLNLVKLLGARWDKN